MATIAAIRCASSTPIPTKEHPLSACYISCPERTLIHQQHICVGKRWFQDILIIGQHTVRNEDGTMNMDLWITKAGDYPKQDVEFGTCTMVISGIVNLRDPSKRGQYEGEDPLGRPND